MIILGEKFLLEFVPGDKSIHPPYSFQHRQGTWSDVANISRQKCWCYQMSFSSHSWIGTDHHGVQWMGAPTNAQEDLVEMRSVVHGFPTRYPGNPSFSPPWPCSVSHEHVLSDPQCTSTCLPRTPWLATKQQYVRLNTTHCPRHRYLREAQPANVGNPGTKRPVRKDCIEGKKRLDRNNKTFLQTTDYQTIRYRVMATDLTIRTNNDKPIEENINKWKW